VFRYSKLRITGKHELHELRRITGKHEFHCLPRRVGELELPAPRIGELHEFLLVKRITRMLSALCSNAHIWNNT